MTRQEFAATIKAKHPEYADKDDSILVDAILKKYPQYADRIDAPVATKPVEAPVSQEPKSLTKQVVDGFNTGAKDLYGKAKTIIAALPAAYVAGTEAAYSPTKGEARGKFDKAYTATMDKAHTPGNLLYDVTDPMNLASLAAPELKGVGVIGKALAKVVAPGAIAAGTEAGRQALSPDEANYKMNPSKIAMAGLLGSGLGAAGSGVKALAGNGFKTLAEKGKLQNLAIKETAPARQMGLSEFEQDLLSEYFENKAKNVKVVPDKAVKGLSKILGSVAGGALGMGHSGASGAALGALLGHAISTNELLEPTLRRLIDNGATKLAKGAATPTATSLANLAKQLAPIKPVTQATTKAITSSIKTDQIKEGAIKTNSLGDKVIFKEGRWVHYNG